MKDKIPKPSILFILFIFGLSIGLIIFLSTTVLMANLSDNNQIILFTLMITFYIYVWHNKILTNKRRIFRVYGYMSYVSIFPMIASVLITFILNLLFGVGSDNDFAVVFMFFVSTSLPYLLLYIFYRKSDFKNRVISELKVGIGFAIAFVSVINHFLELFQLNSFGYTFIGLSSFSFAINVLMLSGLAYLDLGSSKTIDVEKKGVVNG